MATLVQFLMMVSIIHVTLILDVNGQSIFSPKYYRSVRQICRFFLLEFLAKHKKSANCRLFCERSEHAV